MTIELLKGPSKYEPCIRVLSANPRICGQESVCAFLAANAPDIEDQWPNQAERLSFCAATRLVGTEYLNIHAAR
jgi:hypothetical protein